jgi:hypothetical protein
MIQNTDAASSGQGPNQVIWFSQMMHFVHTDVNSLCKQLPKTCVACKSPFDRNQELERHTQSFHLPYSVYCPHSCCNWRGPRIDELRTHYAKHLGQHEESAELDEYLIYDVKMVLDWIKNAKRGDFIRTAQNWALELVRQKTNELGKHEWLNDLGCCLEERERRAQHPRRRRASKKKNGDPSPGY